LTSVNHRRPWGGMRAACPLLGAQRFHWSPPPPSVSRPAVARKILRHPHQRKSRPQHRRRCRRSLRRRP
jgi:hypothetical protein